MNFADRLTASIKENKSFIVAGFDPVLDTFPDFFLQEGAKEKSNEDAIYRALSSHYESAFEALRGVVAAIKPNIAFFEQYGLGGLRAFERVCSLGKERRLPVIVDAKRGDIGSTAAAYSNAFLGRVKSFGKEVKTFEADAVTVNPFLGFDTIEPFVKNCTEYGKGIFILVKTSNPGSAAIQGIKDSSTKEISELVAEWIEKNTGPLMGSCGFSALGAVVGAPYPSVAVKLRSIMPHSFFLVPGLGAQGGTAADAVAGFGAAKDGTKGGAIINASRGILSTFKSPPGNAAEFKEAVRANAVKFNEEISLALGQ
jgi:orotidine-5'-phosphate decarboxylase